jgi:tetratricopeptide (TPR) repeat protein
MRPDRDTPGWEIKETAERDYPHRYTEISLHPLTSDDTNVLVDNLLTIANLPASLRENILAKTDGNPFFVEEVVRTLIDSGAIVSEKEGDITRWRAIGSIEEIEIPGNLQSLLTARIDRLEEDARLTLQLASVIGRSFFYRVLESINQTVAAIHSELDQQLLALQRMELIREAARVPELEYIFRHSLTQEAAYNTILLRQRGEFHSQVGKAIETLFTDRLEEFYPLLAYHFGEAGDSRAQKYAILSGDAAFKIFAIPEAMGYYHQALEYSKSGQELPEQLTHIYLRYGRCLELQSDYQAAQQNYEEMASQARQENDRRMLLAALLAGAIAYAIPSPAQQSEKGQNLADQSLTLAREIGDQEAEAKTLWVFMLLKIYGGLVPTAVPFGVRSIELARELGMDDQLAHSLQDLALAYISLGDLDKADAALAEARPLWKTLSNLPMLAENWANTSYLRVDTANFDEAIAAAKESLRIAKSIENEWGKVNSQGFVVLVYLARGEVDLAIQTINRLINDAERLGHPGHIIGHGYLSLLYSHLGAYDLALESALRGVEASISFPPFRPLNLAMLAKQKIRQGEFAEAQSFLAESGESDSRLTLSLNIQAVDMETIRYHLSLGEFSQAHSVIELLLKKMKDSSSRYFLPDALYLKAIYLEKLERTDEARKALQEAQTIAEEIGDRIILWQILADLGEVEYAGEIVESIAEAISDAPLRETFLTHSKTIIERGGYAEQIGV